MAQPGRERSHRQRKRHRARSSTDPFNRLVSNDGVAKPKHKVSRDAEAFGDTLPRQSLDDVVADMDRRSHARVSIKQLEIDYRSRIGSHLD